MAEKRAFSTPSFALAAMAILAPACGRSELPDPRAAAHAYAEAAARGDAEALHGMLTSESRRAFGREGTKRLLADARAEIGAQGRALLRPGARVEATATLPLRDGTSVELALGSSGFRIASADTLPSGARTPVEALEDLRAALARRSYPTLLRVLSSKARTAVEKDLRSLENGLADPKTLDVKVTGDRAEVEIPGGHAVTLEREGGTWRVDDIQ
jgi:hypothetical protein